MSEYENYDETSRHYDETRKPVGIEIILGCLIGAEKPLSEMVVLDAGCGTGSYAIEVAKFVGRVAAVDASEGMLRQARTRADGTLMADKLSFKLASIDALPFADASFDAVMVNQVLHHVGSGSENLDPYRAVLNELARVVRPGGVLVINMCSIDQLHGGWWYAELFRGAFERMAKRHIGISDLTDLLGECGFLHRGRIVPTGAVFQGKAYFDGTGPLRKEWRDGDSLFALTTEEELQGACSTILQLEENGTLEDYVARNDALREQIGQVTFVHSLRAAEHTHQGSGGQTTAAH